MSYCSPASSSFLNYIDESQLFSAIGGITFITLTIFWYILRSYTFFDKHHITARAVRPKAPFGNIKEVINQNTSLYIYLWKYYNKFKRQGNKFGGFFLFLKPGILLVHPALTYKILTDKKLFEDVSRKNQLELEDSKKISKMFDKHALENLILKFENLKSQFIQNIGSDNDPSWCIYNFLVETSCTAFGFKFEKNLKSIVDRMVEEKTSSNLSHYFHLVYPYFVRKQTYKELKIYVQAVIDSRKKNDTREYDVIQNYIDFLNEDVPPDAEKLIIEEILDIFIDNIHQTYSAVSFCLYELASNCEIQLDLIGEIRRFNKANIPINLSNSHQLIYLEAIVKETLRKYPPIPLVTKRPKRDYINAEFDLKLPKSCLVFTSIFGIHHDPSSYLDPESFDPDRFFEDNVKFLKPNTYIPFGVDYRKNIGFSMTLLHIKLCIFTILSSFKVSLTDERKTVKFDTKKLTTFPKEPLPLKFEEIK
ncbi:unnamed protein product [Phaedon cochleariae]|uniref:Cytochrome P450 n=1 Tax=Phaedon cochleariae TaxID=80249 RepID=A0A9N9SL69_PHACE|nr:unnamed protein product [Phaedon cochleariae]